MSSDDASDRERLREALEHARHFLPSQGPIRVFVHHNTLHAFQHLPFDAAVVRAARLFGTEPYESEEAFAQHFASGRITPRDVAAVLVEENLSLEPRLPGGWSVQKLRELRLLNPLERVERPALQWLLDEGEAFSDFHPRVSNEARGSLLASAKQSLGRSADTSEALATLFARLLPHAPRLPTPVTGCRPRDRVLVERGVDVDEWTRPLLIRLCAAFVDQGVAYWSMPGRERGLLGGFRWLYARPLGPPDAWLHGLSRRLSQQERENYDAERTAAEALQQMRVPAAFWGEVIEATLRALPGWAGMIAQLEERPETAPVKAPPARLMDFLAVALLLEAQAVEYALSAYPVVAERQKSGAHLATAYEAFVVAQLAGLGPAELDAAHDASAFLREISAFDSIERRRLWHLAYEHHHRQAVLDGVLAHARLGVSPLASPSAQAIFCIDERAESLRRHLEESDPSIETLGYAGFFSVAMAYRGLTDVRPMPLCPIVIKPRHLVVEEAVDAKERDVAASQRRRMGSLLHGWHVGSQTFVRGGLLSASVGLGAIVPLIGRSLFPRLTERFTDAVHHTAVGAPKTRLRIERKTADDTLDADGLLPGFTVAEMADVVSAVLRTCGIDGRLASLVVVVGHGSSSLNNPHESAHDCGATGGGRGGPNARAFAAMANHPEVRVLLQNLGLQIPQESWFVGAYHNTCDDSVTWYDVDLVPAERRDDLTRTQVAFERARRLDAHERCRRFEGVPFEIDPGRALAHVERRSSDLGEPRPEYGHATNAVCIVGRRERTRGLFLDRRAFLVSYDPTSDTNGEILGPLLASVGPVGAGINLEYYFSFVDPSGYGCGTKLPHNITGLVGVMDGHASDLRTGLPWQMVEIHEPVRLLTLVEAEPEQLERVLNAYPAVAEVVTNRWIQLVAWSPSTGQMWFLSPKGLSLNGFVQHVPHTQNIPVVSRSIDHYRGHREHLGPARVQAGLAQPLPLGGEASWTHS